VAELTAERGSVRFAHPVRDLPRLLADLEGELERPLAAALFPEEEEEDADAGIRRWRLRRRLLTLLGIAAAVFVMLGVASGQGLYVRHLPLLAFAALLVTAAASPPVSPRLPWRRDPFRRGLAAGLALALAAAVLTAVRHLVPALAAPASGLYLMLGTLAVMFLVLGGLRSPRSEASSASRASSPPAQPRPKPAVQPEPVDPVDFIRLDVLKACREAVEQIATNAPKGAMATGWLDLTGPAEPPARQVWWRLRLPWENGARLRLAGIEEPAESGTACRLLANLAVDPRRWRTEPGGTRNATFGLLTVESFEVTRSRVSLRVLSPRRAFRPYDLIEMLKALEERVQPVPPVEPAAPSGEAPA
jgi:hypothetical protein